MKYNYVGSLKIRGLKKRLTRQILKRERNKERNGKEERNGREKRKKLYECQTKILRPKYY